MEAHAKTVAVQYKLDEDVLGQKLMHTIGHYITEETERLWVVLCEPDELWVEDVSSGMALGDAAVIDRPPPDMLIAAIYAKVASINMNIDCVVVPPRGARSVAQWTSGLVEASGLNGVTLHTSLLEYETCFPADEIAAVPEMWLVRDLVDPATVPAEQPEPGAPKPLKLLSTNAIGDDWKVYPCCCMGGTFDRLHNGHRLLLTHGLLHSGTVLKIGVSSPCMLEDKTLSELIQPLEERMEAVRAFCNAVVGDVEADVFPITDPWGPTLTDPDLDAMVVSEETAGGGETIRTRRLENGLDREIDVVVVSLLTPAGADLRLSSTQLRQLDAAAAAAASS